MNDKRCRSCNLPIDTSWHKKNYDRCVLSGYKASLKLCYLCNAKESVKMRLKSGDTIRKEELKKLPSIITFNEKDPEELSVAKKLLKLINFIEENPQVCCTKCGHLNHSEDGTLTCPYESKCGISDAEDFKAYEDRPYYEEAADTEDTKDALDQKTLKSCPFCDGDAGYEEDKRFESMPDDFPKWYILCKNCGIRTPVARRDYVQNLWNKRG